MLLVLNAYPRRTRTTLSLLRRRCRKHSPNLPSTKSYVVQSRRRTVCIAVLLSLEAQRTVPAACAMFGNATEAAGSWNRRSRRLHNVSKNPADFSGFGRTPEDGIFG